MDLELVTTAGYGKNGALCVLQRSIRPQIVTTFTLPGCSNMWTVHDGDDKHAFLILSQEDCTMVCNYIFNYIYVYAWKDKVSFKLKTFINKYITRSNLLSAR